jgi:arginine decarboxylase
MENQILTHEQFQTNDKTVGLWVGNRIPWQYFETYGTGESNIAIHAGSFHLALKDAHIEKYNIMTYSSILPGIAEKIEYPGLMIHGSVMESIMSVCHSTQGQLATAGIIYGWLYDRETGEKYGGLVCEHSGNYDERELKYRLDASLEELYTEGFSVDYEIDNIELLSQSFIPNKKHGTALVALCFTSYYYPIIPNKL